jgi:putative ABC transport system permease protein
MLWDLRFALRLFRKHPLPVGIGIGGLALAIGVVTSVFSLVNATLLRPYGMDQPSSVVSVTRPVDHRWWSHWPYQQFLRMQHEATLSSVEAALAERVRFSAAPAADGAPGRRILFVSGGYLRMLGGRASVGRALQPSDDVAGAPAVVVVSHYFWSTQFNRDPSAVGRTVWLNGSPVTVVGVLPPDFTGPTDLRPSFWAPFAAFDDVGLGRSFDPTTRTLVEVVARLAPGSALRAAQDQLTAIMKRSNTAAATADAPVPVTVVRLSNAASPIHGPDAGESYVAIACIFAVVGFVLAMACANMANLLLAGAATRSREIGIRLALGSTTTRLVRQLISESLLLALTAGGLGLLFAVWFVPILGSIIQMPSDFAATPDGRVLFFAMAIAMVCGLGAGISPARYGARGDVLSALRSQSGRSGRAAVPSRRRTSFVAFQSAVSMALLVSAALLARTAILMTRADIGFDADRMLAVSLSGPRTGFNEAAYFQIALAALREVPSVDRTSLTQYPPFGHVVERERFSHDGRSYTLYVNRSDADYFSTADLRILRGRAFTADEVAREAPVALISDGVARTFFAGTDPVGQSVAGVSAESSQAPATIIGVVADAIVARLRTQSFGTIYRPLSQQRPNLPSIVIRTTNPGVAARAVEDVLRPIDPRVRTTTTVVRDELDGYLGQKRMLAWLSGLVGSLALLLAALGVYGVTAFVVNQRTQEVSVRMALGATPADMRRLLVRESLRPVMIGLTVGLGAALVGSRTLAIELPGISPHDPFAVAVAAATLLVSALLAVAVPVRRVSTADPATMLRQV